MSKLREFPDDWHCVKGRGIDTGFGTIFSTEHKDLAIHYVNGLEEDKVAKPEENPGYKWQKTGRIKKTKRRGRRDVVEERSFTCLLTKEHKLYIAFPEDYPPEVFSAKVKTTDEIHYVVELVLRYGDKLKEKGRYYEDLPEPLKKAASDAQLHDR